LVLAGFPRKLKPRPQGGGCHPIKPIDFQFEHAIAPTFQVPSQQAAMAAVSVFSSQTG
jgi:hypothetical protein